MSSPASRHESITWSAIALTCGDDWPEHTTKKRVTSVTLRTSITVISTAFFSSANRATLRAVARVAPAGERRGAGNGVFTSLRFGAFFVFGAVLRFVTSPPSRSFIFLAAPRNDQRHHSASNIQETQRGCHECLGDRVGAGGGDGGHDENDH